MQTSKLVFSTVAVDKVTREETKAELYMVEEEGKKPFFVSDHPNICTEALAQDVLKPYNPFDAEQRTAAVLLAMIAVAGFKNFEEE